MTTEGFWYSFCLFHRFVFQPTKWHTKTCYNTFIAFNSIRFMSLNFWIDVFRWCFSASLLAVANGDALVRRKAKELHRKWPKTYEHTDWLAYLNSANFFFLLLLHKMTRNSSTIIWDMEKHQACESFSCPSSFVPNITNS